MIEQLVVHADCRDLARQLVQACSLADVIVTDPPYGLGFMNKMWDRGVPDAAAWAAILDATAPGAWLVASGGTRTAHRLTCAIEDGGWEITDTLAWLYGTGFPKAQSCLKPAYEPIVLARKPGPTRELNIDACRIEVLDQKGGMSYAGDSARVVGREHGEGVGFAVRAGDPRDGLGRYPPNVCLDEEAAVMLDAQTGTLVSGKVTKAYSATLVSSVALGNKRRNLDPTKVFSDAGGASRFMYVAKASRAERTHGGAVENKHPTVKPVSLMRWLVRLVTPAGGRVWDPFCGSGSTLVACKLEGFDALGCDLDETNVATSRARIAATSER